MRAWFVFLYAIAALSFPSTLVGQASPGQDGCKAYYALEPLDQGVLKLLSSPVVPPKPNEFANASIKQLQQWDLPAKVTSWHERPSPQELARRWDELNQKFNPGPSARVARPYGWRPLAAQDWRDLQEWFAKEGPKKVPGMCVDQGKATYVLAIGIISGGGTATSQNDPNARIQYQQSETARQQDSNVGPYAAATNPAAHESSAHELSQIGGASDADRGIYTCAFLYRANGGPVSQGGMRQAAPEYYYCKSSGEMPKSAVTTMLKYLAKTNQP